jgi:hypothetical protein
MKSNKEPNIVEKKGINQEILTEIIEDILDSKDGTIFPYQQLCDVHQLKDRRILRKYIEAARRLFEVPIAVVPRKGYKKANDWDDYKNTYYEQVSHSITAIITQNKVRKAFAKRMNLSLFDQSMAFDPAFEDIIRAVDRFQEKQNAQ